MVEEEGARWLAKRENTSKGVGKGIAERHLCNHHGWSNRFLSPFQGHWMKTLLDPFFGSLLPSACFLAERRGSRLHQIIYVVPGVHSFAFERATSGGARR